MTSYQWSGKDKKFYQPVLAKLYPNTYLFYPWDNTLNYWAEAPRFIKEKPAYLYFENINLKDKVMPELEKYIPKNYQLNEVFFNPETNEKIFKIETDIFVSELENAE